MTNALESTYRVPSNAVLQSYQFSKNAIKYTGKIVSTLTHPCTVTYVDVQKCAKIVHHHTLHCCVRDMSRNNYF